MLIRVCRIKSRMTITKLASELGISREYLSKIEAGLCYPSIPMLLKISKLLNIEPVELFANILSNYRTK